MGLTGVLFAVAGTLFDKYLLEKYFGKEADIDSGPGALIIFSSLFLILVLISVFVTKYHSLDFSLAVGVTGIIVGFMNGGWILLYLHAINRADVSRAVPVFQTIPVFGFILGFLFLGESLSLSEILSGSLIILGSLALMYSNINGTKILDYSTLLLMLGASLLVAVSQVIFKLLSIDQNYWTATFWLSSGFILFGIFLSLFIEDYRDQFVFLFETKVKNVLTLSAVNELFDNVGEFIFLAAVVVGPIALVQSLNAYEPLFIFMLSVTLAEFFPKYFHEDITTSALSQKITGIFIISVGSIMLYSSF